MASADSPLGRDEPEEVHRQEVAWHVDCSSAAQRGTREKRLLQDFSIQMTGIATKKRR
jgi:hypothetical protein